MNINNLKQIIVNLKLNTNTSFYDINKCVEKKCLKNFKNYLFYKYFLC